MHLVLPAPRGRRLLVRLCLFVFCGGLLLLLSSRPANAAERPEPRLLDPVRMTLKATAREVDSFASRATGSGSSSVGSVANPVRGAPSADRRDAAPQPRPVAHAARSVLLTVKRGAPAVPSPVRRPAPPTRSAPRDAVGSAAKLATGPVGRVLAPVTGVTAPILRPLAPALGPVGSALAPVGAVLAPVTGPVGGLVAPLVPGGLLPMPGLGGSGTGSTGGAGSAGPVAPVAGARGTGTGASAGSNEASQTYPARPAADGASSPATRSIRSWPALTGAVSLPGDPTSAELPAGGPDPVSSSSGAGVGLVALAAALLVLGLRGRGFARPVRSGLLSRSYLPLVSPA